MFVAAASFQAARETTAGSQPVFQPPRVVSPVCLRAAAPADPESHPLPSVPAVPLPPAPRVPRLSPSRGQAPGGS